jgi:hypothetical protein
VPPQRIENGPTANRAVFILALFWAKRPNPAMPIPTGAVQQITVNIVSPSPLWSRIVNAYRRLIGASSNFINNEAMPLPVGTELI